MAYKSKRTRDLQGEVQAGTNVSVVKTTKPDGTNVYTLSAEGGEITISGSGLQLVENVLTNLMAQRMGWTDESMGKINWTDDNGDDILVIDPLEKIFIGDADDGASFFIKQLDSIGAHKLISGDIEIAENEVSTEGVSLNTLMNNVNTLMNNVNSCCQYEIGVYYDNNILGIDNIYSTDIEDYPVGSFYKDVEIDNFYGFRGLQIKKAGVYRISIRIEIKISATSDIVEIPLILKTYANGEAHNTLRYRINTTKSNTGEYRGTLSTSVLMAFEENDIFTFSVDNNNPNITNMSAWYDDYTMNIEKVR
jgi:hypothetical protein